MASAGQPRAPSNASDVRALERAIELLFLLADHHGTLSLQRMAEAIGSSKSTVYRLLTTLEHMGIVHQDAQTSQYRFGDRMEELARKFFGQVDICRVALPFMAELRDRSGETVVICLVDGVEHVVAEQCESREEVRRVFPIGQRTPLYIGATAKAILAALPAEEVQTVLRRTRPTTGSAQKPPTMQELTEISSLGYAYSAGDRVPGGSVLSAPIVGTDGRARAALSIAGPDFRFTEQEALACAPALVWAARRLSFALGGPPA